MKKVLVAVLLLLGGWGWVSAHGGAQYSLGEHRLTVQQIPLSPLAGEQVTINIAIESASHGPVTESPYNLKLIKVSSEQDQTISDLTLKSGTSGMITLRQTFADEGLYRLEMIPSGHELKATHTIQVRRNLIGWPMAAFFALLGLLGGWMINQLSRPLKARELVRSFVGHTRWPLRLIALGARPVAIIEGNRLEVHWGWLVSAEADLAQLSHIRPTEWKWWYGLGVHWSLGHLFINGSRKHLLTLTFEVPQKANSLGIKLQPLKLTINPVKQQEFLDAVNSLGI